MIAKRLLPLLAALFAPIAGAQEIDAQKMHAFLYGEVHRNLVANALTAIPPSVFQRCPGLISNGSQTHPLQPISFGADGVPNSGAWKVEMPISGCGNDTVLNLYFFVAKDGVKINTAIGFPGSTHANLILQNDAVRYARIGASLRLKECKQFEVKNTRFEAFGLTVPPTADPGMSVKLRPWWETWTLVGCDHTYDVMMNFIPDEKGTTIVQPTGQVQER